MTTHRIGEGRLPAAPLLRQIKLRGGPAACGIAPHSAEERAYNRARSRGVLTERAADRLCVVVGLVPELLWSTGAPAQPGRTTTEPTPTPDPVGSPKIVVPPGTSWWRPGRLPTARQRRMGIC